MPSKNIELLRGTRYMCTNILAFEKSTPLLAFSLFTLLLHFPCRSTLTINTSSNGVTKRDYDLSFELVAILFERDFSSAH